MSKDFLVRSTSEEQVFELLQRLVYNGVVVEDCVSGIELDNSNTTNIEKFDWDEFQYWGCVDNETHTTDSICPKSPKYQIKTMVEVREEFPHPDYDYPHTIDNSGDFDWSEFEHGILKQIIEHVKREQDIYEIELICPSCDSEDDLLDTICTTCYNSGNHNSITMGRVLDALFDYKYDGESSSELTIQNIIDITDNNEIDVEINFTGDDDDDVFDSVELQLIVDYLLAQFR